MMTQLYNIEIIKKANEEKEELELKANKTKTPK